uniref:CLCA_X family protein n=1 Tax=Ningiella ruwaisensis TaxID=2364274 RepID=UPI001F500E3A|nr:CLCA_X family protein [Ningiella ruwaisensis]
MKQNPPAPISVSNAMPKQRLHRAFFRNGANHRAGADVSFADIVKIFGFRGIEVGRWVTPQEQQIAANLFFDALCDMMDILQVPESVLSLKGTLALAFGTGGRRYVCAHYSSQKRQLALAKNAGGGALAHEWFHAFDHYICEKAFVGRKPHQFASEVWLNELLSPESHPLNTLLFEFFQSVFLSEPKGEPSALVKASITVDKSQSSYYYARPQELCARAFEAVVQANVIKNAFLVQGTQQSKEAELGLYPKSDLCLKISEPLYAYFYQLGKALG